jgi:Protein kinase domain
MIGKTIGSYRIIDKIGHGGMGVVYKAVDVRLDRTVALKLLPGHLSGSKADKERFLQEARAASALDHPNICTIYEINETADGTLYIAMGYYDGETLRERIARSPIPFEEALQIAFDIARGLERAHENNITHRDMKPANVILGRRGETKIIDFGVAKLARSTGLTKTGSTIGTVAYMSPEQARGERVDTRSDIWAWGVILYEMIAGIRPFAGDFEQAIVYFILNEDPVPLRTRCPDAPPEIAKIVSRALNKDPGARYQGMSQVIADLRPLVVGDLSTSPLAVGNHRRPGKKVVVTAGIVVGVAAIVAGALWFSRQKMTADGEVHSVAARDIGSGTEDHPAVAPPIDSVRADAPPEHADAAQTPAKPAVPEPATSKTTDAVPTPAPVKSGKTGSTSEPQTNAGAGGPGQDAAAAAEVEQQAAAARAAEQRALETQLAQARTEMGAARDACPADASVFPSYASAAAAAAQAASSTNDPAAGASHYRDAMDLYRRAATERADAEKDIRALIEQYRAALEDENAGSLAALHDRMASSEKTKWENFFASVDHVKASMVPGAVRFDDKGAASTVEVGLVYQGAGGGTASYEWKMRFVNKSDRWFVSGIQQTVH